MFVPSVLDAPRGLPPLIASVKAVVVSTDPAASMRPTTRLTDEEVDEVILAIPMAASYPGTIRYCPSTERVINPSDIAVPLAVNRLREPLTAVGRLMD